jgi:hypothetical protein
VAEAGGVFGRGDPEHLQQQRLVGALLSAGRGQDDAVGLALDAAQFATDRLGLQHLDARLERAV